MGLFSKLNFRAVHEAYCDVTAINFLTELVCLLFGAMSEPTQTVRIGQYVDKAAQLIANSVFQLTDGSGITHAAAMSRLSEVASSYKRLLRREFGEEAEISIATEYCSKNFNVVSQKVIRSVHKGYLSLTASDVFMLLEKNEERMYLAGIKAVERNEVYLSALESTVNDKEQELHKNQAHKQANEPSNNTNRTIFSEKSDRAVHNRADINIDHRKESSFKEEGSVQRQSNRKIDEATSETKKRGFMEKSDRAVHRRSEIKTVNSQPAATPTPRVDINTSYKSKPTPISEPFDLLGVNGDLLADIGFEMVNGFSVLFSAGERPPLSKSQTFSPTDDDQPDITVHLAMRFGKHQIIRLWAYQIFDINPAPRGAPEITVTITIENFQIKFTAEDSTANSSLRVLKVA